MVNNNASTEVVDKSPPWVVDQVRLYFRPRTPTFYRNEGIQPRERRSSDDDAHCPLPVALLFDAKLVLGQEGVRWSREALSRHIEHPWLGSDASSLEAMPFERIYDESYVPADRRDLRGPRQAEVIVPERLSLEGLQEIVVRSEADRQTLHTVLGSTRRRSDRNSWPFNLIKTDYRLFCGKWPSIERVDRIDESIRFEFSPGRQEWVTYETRLVWRNATDEEVHEESGTRIGVRDRWRAPIPAALRDVALRVSLYLDDVAAFTGWFSPEIETLIPPPG